MLRMCLIVEEKYDRNAAKIIFGNADAWYDREKEKKVLNFELWTLNWRRPGRWNQLNRAWFASRTWNIVYAYVRKCPVQYVSS